MSYDRSIDSDELDALHEQVSRLEVEVERLWRENTYLRRYLGSFHGPIQPRETPEQAAKQAADRILNQTQ